MLSKSSKLGMGEALGMIHAEESSSLSLEPYMKLKKQVVYSQNAMSGQAQKTSDGHSGSKGEKMEGKKGVISISNFEIHL